MIAAWMMYSAIIGVLLGAAAQAAERFCRLLRIPTRWVWIGGMSGTLVLSCVALARLEAQAPGAAGHAADAVNASVPGAAAAEFGVRARLAQMAARTRTQVSAGARRVYGVAGVNERMDRSLLLVWAMSSVVLLLLLCGTLLRLSRARRRWPEHRIGPVAVLVSGGTGPALIGLSRPQIVVPAWLLGEPEAHQQLVVQHEDEHRRAGDHLMLTVASVMICLQPWNVALWWMLRRTRLAVEIDCDARVLRRGARARSYGALLLDIAARSRGQPFSAPALTDSTTHLERRLIAMTEKNCTPRPSAALVAGLPAVLLVLAACAADLPTAAAIDDMDVVQAQLQAERAGMVVPMDADERPLFIVDGVIVAEAAARALAPGQIASIEVVKAAAALQAYGDRGAHGVVTIVTRREVEREAVDAQTPPLGVPLSVSDGSGLVEREQAMVERESAVVRLRAARATGSAVRGDNPLILVDGVIVSDGFSINSMDRDSVERIEVLKGEAARRLYDHPRAANGVILITTKPDGR